MTLGVRSLGVIGHLTKAIISVDRSIGRVIGTLGSRNKVSKQSRKKDYFGNRIKNFWKPVDIKNKEREDSTDDSWPCDQRMRSTFSKPRKAEMGVEYGRSACVLSVQPLCPVSVYTSTPWRILKLTGCIGIVHRQAKREGSYKELVWFLLYLPWQSICSKVLESQPSCWQDHSRSQPVVLPLVLRLKKFSGGRFRNLLWITAQPGNIFLSQWGFSLYCVLEHIRRAGHWNVGRAGGLSSSHLQV